MENSIEKQFQPLQMSRSISCWESIQPTGKDTGINLVNISRWSKPSILYYKQPCLEERNTSQQLFSFSVTSVLRNSRMSFQRNWKKCMNNTFNASENNPDITADDVGILGAFGCLGLGVGKCPDHPDELIPRDFGSMQQKKQGTAWLAALFQRAWWSWQAASRAWASSWPWQQASPLASWAVLVENSVGRWRKVINSLCLALVGLHLEHCGSGASNMKKVVINYSKFTRRPL